MVWLENLNLRGGCKAVILDYIARKYPALVLLYDVIYKKGDRSYWAALDEEMHQFAKEEGLFYVRNDDSIKHAFEEPPMIVNYFFHEEIVPSFQKKEMISEKRGGIRIDAASWL